MEYGAARAVIARARNTAKIAISNFMIYPKASHVPCNKIRIRYYYKDKAKPSLPPTVRRSLRTDRRLSEGGLSMSERKRTGYPRRCCGGYFFETTLAACQTGCQAQRVEDRAAGDLASRRSDYSKPAIQSHKGFRSSSSSANPRMSLSSLMGAQIGQRLLRSRSPPNAP